MNECYIASYDSQDEKPKSAINLFNALHLLRVAWNEVTPDTIVNGFLKAGLIEGQPSVNETDPVDQMCIDSHLLEVELRQMSTDSDEVSMASYIN